MRGLKSLRQINSLDVEMYCLNSHKGRHARPRHRRVKECACPNHGWADTYTSKAMTRPKKWTSWRLALVQSMDEKKHNLMLILLIRTPTKQSNSWTSKGLGLIFKKYENQLSLRTNKANNYLFYITQVILMKFKQQEKVCMFM